MIVASAKSDASFTLERQIMCALHILACGVEDTGIATRAGMLGSFDRRAQSEFSPNWWRQTAINLLAQVICGSAPRAATAPIGIDEFGSPQWQFYSPHERYKKIHREAA